MFVVLIMFVFLDIQTPTEHWRKTTSFYIQLNKEFELFGRPANVVAGLRHEETEITSTSLSQVPVASNWATANEFYLGFAPGEAFLL